MSTHVPVTKIRPGDEIEWIGGKTFPVQFVSRVPAQPWRPWRRSRPALVILWSDPVQADAAERGWFATSSATARKLSFDETARVRLVC